MGDDNIVGIHGGPIDPDLPNLPDQLFTAQDVIDGVPKDLHRVVVVGEDLDGNLYVSSTHHSGFVSLLLGKAQHLVHSKYEMR